MATPQQLSFLPFHLVWITKVKTIMSTKHRLYTAVEIHRNNSNKFIHGDRNNFWVSTKHKLIKTVQINV